MGKDKIMAKVAPIDIMTLQAPITPRDHVLGPGHAMVTLVEYGDYECPHCAAANPVVKLVLRHFRNELRFVFRHFPLSQIHPNAETAAETAEFCGAYGRFWEMHDAIFDNQNQLDFALLFSLTSAFGLSETELREALVKGNYEKKVRSDFLGGVRSGVNGTPSFFFNERRHVGSYAYGDLVSAVEANLYLKSGMQSLFDK
jgi:protein-disulfide isomerase